MRTINKLIIHCSATKPDMDIGAEEIRRWHKGKGWRDIGYHYVIRRDGTVEDGRALEDEGAHTLGHNKASIGICLVGGIGDNLKPDANFTHLQYVELYNLVDYLRAKYPDVAIHGHRDFARKACPCFDVHEFFREQP